MPRDYFPRVKEAREVLRERALELYTKYELLIDAAMAEKQFDVAGKHLQWLIEHMPKGDDGETIVDESAATPKESKSGPTGPTIQIGVIVGGTTPPKQLRAPVIDITPIDDSDKPSNS